MSVAKGNAKRDVKTLVREKEVVPRSGAVLALVSLILIALGMAEAIFLFDFTNVEIMIMAVALMLFYAILLLVLLRPRTVRVARKRDMKRDLGAQSAIASQKTDGSQMDDYVASTATKTYHKKTCGLAKKIKSEARVTNNSREFFVNQKYKACRVCKPGKNGV